MRYLIITVVTLFALMQAQSSVASPLSQQRVIEGRVLLFDSGNSPPIPTYSGLSEANEKFKSAVAEDATDPLANLFYAVTRVMVSYIEQGNTAEIETVRDLLEAIGLTRNLEDSMDFAPYNDAPKIDGTYVPPSAIPSGEEFQSFLAGDFITLVDSAINNLNVITSESFTTTLTIAETGDFPTEIDYGDVLLVKSFLYTFKAFIQIFSAYDMNINLRDTIILANADVIQLQRDLLDKYNSFLSLHTDGASRLSSARETLLLAINTCRAAFNFIVSETDGQNDDFFSFGSDEEVAEARAAMAGLTEAQNSMIANRPYTQTEEDWLLTFDGSTQIELDFYLDEQGNFIAGYLSDINSNFYAWINDFTIVGSTISIEFGFDQGGICPGTLSTTGTLSGGQITGGTYNITDCSGPDSGTFTGSRQYSGTESDVDINAVFGNTGKPPLDIRGILPTMFDTDNEVIAGTFPQPYLNNIITGIDTEMQLVSDLGLSVVYDIKLGSIILDGAGTDWTDTLAVAEDDLNDAYMGAPNGNDFSRLYAARDSNYFYWMMELNDPPVHNNIYYSFVAVGETNNKTFISNVYNGTYSLYSYDKFGTYEPISIDPNDMGTGNVVEARIPIEQFDGTVKIDVDGNGYDHIGGMLLRFPNDAALSGSLICNSCNGSGKIFIYVYDGPDPATNRLLGTAVLDTPGNYTVTGLPIGEEVHVFAHWDADDNGIQTYGDFIGNSGDTSVEILPTGTSSDINVTTELISPLLNGGIFAENRAYSEFFTNLSDYYEMRGWARSYSNSLPIYARNIPHSSGALQVKIPYLSKLDLLAPPAFTFSRKFSAGGGFILPGIVWQGRTFPIYLDENLNSALDPGEPSFDWTIPEGSLQQLNIPEVEITGRLNPTITWQKVPEAERYNIRLWTITEQKGLGDMLYSTFISADGSQSYSYTYDGDLFSQHSTLAVTVMADDVIDSGVYNRSTYVTTHSTRVNLPGVMLLLLD